MRELLPKEEQKWGVGLCQQFPESVYAPFDAQEMLLDSGWTLASDRVTELGFDPNFRGHVLTTYFGANGILRPETYDVFPPDRMRARGVVTFEFAADGRGIVLRDYEDDKITGKDYHENERHYEVTPLMHDPYFQHHLTQLLSLLPRPVASEANGPWAAQRDAISLANSLLLQNRNWKEPEQLIQEYVWQQRAGCRGIIGVNFFEVFYDVVSGFHHDGVHYVIVDRLERHGDGTTTQLQALGAPRDLTSIERTLNPGQKLIFDDRLRAHQTKPLEPAADGSKPFMRTLVITVDFEKPLTIVDLEKQVRVAGRYTHSGILVPALS